MTDPLMTGPGRVSTTLATVLMMVMAWVGPRTRTAWRMWTLRDLTGTGPWPANPVGNDRGPMEVGTLEVGTVAAAVAAAVAVVAGLTVGRLGGGVGHARPPFPRTSFPAIYSAQRTPSPSTASRSGCDGRRREGRAPQLSVDSRLAVRGTPLATAMLEQNTLQLEQVGWVGWVGWVAHHCFPLVPRSLLAILLAHPIFHGSDVLCTLCCDWCPSWRHRWRCWRWRSSPCRPRCRGP